MQKIGLFSSCMSDAATSFVEIPFFQEWHTKWILETYGGMREYYDYLYEKFLRETTSEAVNAYTAQQEKKTHRQNLAEEQNAERIRQFDIRRLQSSCRLSQSDVSSISMDASQPIPPTMLMKGGMHYALGSGV